MYDKLYIYNRQLIKKRKKRASILCIINFSVLLMQGKTVYEILLNSSVKWDQSDILLVFKTLGCI